MGQCFVPDCNHTQESHTCKFFRFPKNSLERKRWIRQIRRDDREPNDGSRVCSCHFRGGDKKASPEVFERNKSKLFDFEEPKPKTLETWNEEKIILPSKLDDQAAKVENIILEAKLENKQRELEETKQKEKYARKCYTVANLSDRVICMETGLPNKDIFQIVVSYVERFKDSVNYFYNWKVECLSLEDQIFITLMKLRQNYTNLHLAQLFACSDKTISNVVLTFAHVLHKLLYQDCMGIVPSREKNKTSMPGSFSLFGNCRMVIDCTDIKVAVPGLMSDQKVTYSSYRGMNSFKVLIGVAPNAVITYVSKLYPGSTSDKEIVRDCGILEHFETGDLVLADKGFLIQDLLPNGVSVNIPPFLNKGKFTASEIKLTKSFATCRIHVERANARLKEFKILSFIPAYMRGYAEKILQLCASLVNLQYPLIKEISDSLQFD
ncbi:uncharacterized protein LOC114973302 [Acropora millepora]|uniref:uncharacterized protein LOC114973302 n=1 Tax=Acropora millepora TaxID=45264 RepID=UPI001CF44984|nr:uncharacterized protein LOC114973302 [Acropora millepora]